MLILKNSFFVGLVTVPCTAQNGRFGLAVVLSLYYICQ